MRSKGGSSKGSVLGCMNGLSAIAEVLAVFAVLGPARANAGKAAARIARYTRLMVVPLGFEPARLLVGPRAGRNGILRAPSMRNRLPRRSFWRGLVRALRFSTQDPYEHHAGPGRQHPLHPEG